MSEAILILLEKTSLASKRVFYHKKATYPKRVNETVRKDDIANLFTDKFCNLYNSVSYNNNEMNVLIKDIGKLIDSKCNCGGFFIGAKDVGLSIKRLKPNKKDDSSEIVSDHIINACNSLSIHHAILFTMMLQHGLSPDGMLFGTMVPIPKR